MDDGMWIKACHHGTLFKHPGIQLLAYRIPVWRDLRLVHRMPHRPMDHQSHGSFPFLEKICGLQLRLVFVIAHRLERKSPSMRMHGCRDCYRFLYDSGIYGPLSHLHSREWRKTMGKCGGWTLFHVWNGRESRKKRAVTSMRPKAKTKNWKCSMIRRSS